MAKNKEEGVKINLRDKTTVYATSKSKYHKVGQAIECHPILAEYMVLNGQAVEKSTKASKEA